MLDIAKFIVTSLATLAAFCGYFVVANLFGASDPVAAAFAILLAVNTVFPDWS